MVECVDCGYEADISEFQEMVKSQVPIEEGGVSSSNEDKTISCPNPTCYNGEVEYEDDCHTHTDECWVCRGTGYVPCDDDCENCSINKHGVDCDKSTGYIPNESSDTNKVEEDV